MGRHVAVEYIKYRLYMMGNVKPESYGQVFFIPDG